MNSTPMNAPTEEIAKRYGLESIPDSVKRLGILVSSQNIDSNEVAKIITQDKDLVARLLKVANPRAEREQDYRFTTVEDCLKRAGMGSVLLLAMHEPLLRAVHKTFMTMLGTELLKRVTTDLPFDGQHLCCEIGFSGRAIGTASLRICPPEARQIAARIVGIPVDALDDDTMVDDVIGELSNMVVGNFKSNLCDAGLKCKLSPPSILHTDDFTLRNSAGSLAERIIFRADGLNLVVELNVDPWGE